MYPALALLLALLPLLLPLLAASCCFLIVAPLDVVDDLEEEVDEEGECDFCDEDALIVVKVGDAAVEGTGDGHDLN